MLTRHLSLAPVSKMSDQPIIVASEPSEVSIYTPRRDQPAATYIILSINFLIFLLMELAGGSKNPDVLLDFGASYGPYIRRGEYWRLVMPMFLHIGWLHLLVNSYALYLLGRILERVYAYGRFALLYVGAGVGSSFLSMRLSNNVAAGASGAIFGVAGAMLVTGYLHREAIPPRWGRAFGRGILPFIVLNLVFGYTVPGIDNWGHLGGLASGILLAFLIPPLERDSIPGSQSEKPSQFVVVIPLAVVAVSMAAAMGHYKEARVVTRLLEEGRQFRARHLDSQAFDRFQEAARRAPRDERPHEQLGLLYLEQRRVDEAIREYNEALRLSPNLPQAQLGLARAYRQKGDLAKARQFFEAVTGKNPATAEGQQILADLFAEQRLYPEAIQHYEGALRIAPDLAPAHNNLAWLYATCEDPKYRNPQRALEHAHRAVELSQWKEANFIDTLAEALYANGDFRHAVEVQTKALQLDPKNPEFQDHLARYRKAAGV